MILVQKYGGTSLAGTPQIERVAEKIARKAREAKLVVVLSAMGDTTDQLIRLARQIVEDPPQRDLDLLVSTGEIVSISLMAMALKKRDVRAVAFTGFQAGILTDGVYARARIVNISTDRLLHQLAANDVLLVAGFQGVSQNDEVTTLGRGGSDTSAVALAAALNVPICEIYTDVDGVYTADPRFVPGARRLRNIGYDEMLELSSLGAKVLHPRAVEVAKVYGVRLKVSSSIHDGEGTMVVDKTELERERTVTGVATDEDVAKISLVGVPDRPGMAARIFRALADAHINVDQISQGGAGGRDNDISFTVSKEDAAQATQIAEKTAKELGATGVRVQDELAKVSIVGAGMVTRPGVAATMFEALAEAGINIEMISSSEIRISALVRKEKAKEAMRVLHDKFALDRA